MAASKPPKPIPRGITVGPRRPLTGPVTGQQYPNARPLGLGDRAPDGNEQYWLDAVNEVRSRLADLLPLTPQAYGYRVASLPGYGFTKKLAIAYMKEFLTNARRNGWVPGEDVDDSRTEHIDVPSDLHPDALDERLLNVARGWERWRRIGQKWVPEVWVEAVGSMRSVVEPSRHYGAGMVSSGGTNSFTEIRALTARAAERYRHRQQRTVVFFIGDYDKKGRERMDRTVADARALFVDEWIGDRARLERLGITPEGLAEYVIAFEWLAVNPDQITEWNLETSSPPGTPDDKKNYEVEAVDPAVLRDHLTDRLDAYTTTRILKRVVAASQGEAATRVARLNGLSD